jgi:hypothetical protein
VMDFPGLLYRAGGNRGSRFLPADRYLLISCERSIVHNSHR